MQNEPSLDQIEDYNDNESPEKRKTVIKVIVFLYSFLNSKPPNKIFVKSNKP